jgi:hypothetical protein
VSRLRDIKENQAMGVLIFQIFCIAGAGFLVFVLVNFIYDEKRNRTKPGVRPTVIRPKRTALISGRK